MGMPALIDEVDRGILLVDELEMEDLTAGPDARVEVLVLEVEREPDLLGVEPDRSGEIRRPQLEDRSRDAHGLPFLHRALVVRSAGSPSGLP